MGLGFGLQREGALTKHWVYSQCSGIPGLYRAVVTFGGSLDTRGGASIWGPLTVRSILLLGIQRTDAFRAAGLSNFGFSRLLVEVSSC